MLPKKKSVRSGAAAIVSDCDGPLQFRVCPSHAGYYIGTYYRDCGPFSRESEYYARRRDAERDLRNQSVRWRH